MGGDEKEKTGDLLARRLAPQRDHPVARLVEFAQRLLMQPVLERRIGRHDRFQRTFGDPAQVNIRGGLGRQAALLAIEPAQKIRRKLQPHDLLASILEHFCELDDAGHHIGVARDVGVVGDQFASRPLAHNAGVS